LVKHFNTFAKQFFYLNRVLFFFFGVLLLPRIVSGQAPADTIHKLPVADTLIHKDTTAAKDTVPLLQPVAMVRPIIIYDTAIAVTASPFSFVTGNWQLIEPTFSRKPAPGPIENLPPDNIRKVKGKELLFYALILLFIVFAVIRRAFAKYLNDLFRLFFKTTLKQRQIREQLVQSPLPSLLLNVFFVISGGLYITFLLKHYSIDPLGNFWLLFLYCAMGLAAAYFVKFAGLKICGWLFNIDEVADSYIFIVFIVNKMAGIFLLPFLLVLAFSAGQVYSVGLTLSWCLIGGLLVYRVILTYGAVRNQVSINLFHFFLYLCAFEIAPLLLVYKALVIFFNQTT
jgi:hypothetical protein